MNKNTKHEPAHPTFPFSDQFGQTVMFLGSSRLELGAFMVAAGIARYSDSLLPETVADEAIEIARHIIERCDQILKEDSKQATSQIITDGVKPGN